MKNEITPPSDPFKNKEFMLRAEKAQPLMVLEYLNSWGNEFLFTFLLIAGAFLLLFVNQFAAEMPETVSTIIGIEVPSYLATQVPVFILIIAAIGLAVYYNMRRRYIENMIYFFFQKLAEQEFSAQQAVKKSDAGQSNAATKTKKAPKKSSKK